jgi:heme/copper-type cytochrome/quinol oxidase subunit 2
MLGAPELLIILLLVIGPIALVLAIVVVVDASGRPEAAWQASGQSKTMWIVLPIVLLFACGIGSLVASIVYLASVRPKLVRSA